MVLRERELECLVGQAVCGEAQQRRPLPVEVARALFGLELLKARPLLFRVEAAQVFDCEQWLDRRVDELQRLAERVQVERRAQHCVAREHAAHSLTERRLVEGRAQVEAPDVVVNVRRRFVLAVEEHPGLQERERVCVFKSIRELRAVFLREKAEGGRARGLFRRRGAEPRDAREVAYGLVLKNLLQRHVQPALAREAAQVDAANRVAAEREVVVVNADALDAEHLATRRRPEPPRRACAAARRTLPRPRARPRPPRASAGRACRSA